MKTALLVTLALAVNGAFAQNAWQHVLQGKTTDVFRLEGKYLAPPPNLSSSTAPALIVRCSQGHLQQNYLDFNAVLAARPGSFPAMMEARIDGNPTYIGADAISPDGRSAYFPRSDLKKILHARQVVIGADENSGPEILVQFEMPDAASIQAACGGDPTPQEPPRRTLQIRRGVLALIF